MRRHVVLALLLLAAIVVTAEPAPAATGGGFFNIRCTLAHRSKDDPIVYPRRKAAGHLHNFVANRSTAFDSTAKTMRAARTTCALSKDTSGYWTPALLNRRGTPVPLRKVLVYYRSASGMIVSPFPRNLKIIAGGDTMHPPAPSRSQMSLSWACGDTAPYTPSPPDCGGTGENVTAHVHFPDCWDGVHTDSANHRSHMTFGTPECPKGWVAVPRLRLHIEYDVVNASGFMLSSDTHMANMHPGQTLHADFWNTWNQAALRFLVNHCVNAGRACGQMTDAKLRSMGFRR